MKKQLNTFSTYLILAVAYILLNLLIPVSKATELAYHLNGTQVRVLTFTYILPILGIWFAAFYGYEKLRRYSELLKKTTEGSGFAEITMGTKWLAWGLPLSAILSTILTGIARQEPHWHSGFIIINNYVALLVSLGAFTYISSGTRRLTDSTKLHPTHHAVQGLMLSFITLGVLYSYFMIHSSEAAQNPFHLPLWLILLTIIVPYLYAWFMGLFAAYEISLYSRNTKGVLYRQALSLLALGISAAIIASIVIQYVTSISPRLSHFTLGYLLIVIYLLLLAYSAGYILIAIGANKLKKIEEV